MKKFVTFKRRDGSKGYVVGDTKILHAELASDLLTKGAEPTGGGFVDWSNGHSVFFGSSGSLGPFDPEAVPKT